MKNEEMKKLCNIDLLVVSNDIKNKVLEGFCDLELVNVKVMSFDELWDKYYFTYDERALYYLVKKYNYQVDVAKMYLKCLVDVGDDDYGSDKIRKIIDLRDELFDCGLLNVNNSFRNYLQGKKIIFYGMESISKKEGKLIEELERISEVSFLEDSNSEYCHSRVYLADTLDEEIEFVAFDIVNRINEGRDINSIKLCGVSSEYEGVIKRVFAWYNIPVVIDNSKIYATKIGQDVINNLDKSSEELIEYLENNYDKSNEGARSIINKIIKILNKYVFVSGLNEVKDLIVDEIKNTGISKENNFINYVAIVNSLREIEEDDLVYLLGFNQGNIPNSYKDEDYFNDDLKERLGLDKVSALNKREYERWLLDIKRTKNLVITSKKTSSLGEYYLSSLVDELGLEVEKVVIGYGGSNLYNKIKLAEKLDVLVKYNEKDKDLECLYGNYKGGGYNSYDSSYKGIDKELVWNYLDKKLVLSYSAMNSYYQCSFRYYLSNVLKLNIFEDNFYTVLGNLFHYVLSKCYRDDFNLRKLYDKYLDGIDYEFDDREKFFLDYLEDELEFIVKTIKKQDEFNSLNKVLTEERIEIDKSREDIKIVFKGFVDKMMLDDNESIISIIDYKTGDPKLNLNNVIYGLDLQLLVYVYLAKNRFSEAKIAGFYLQKILNNEVVKDFKNSYDCLKEDKLKLQGYSNSSIDVLEQFDSGYCDSKVIKGMKVGKNGISSKKIFSDEEIEKLVSIADDKIEEAITGIINADFSINPKRVGMDNMGCCFCKFKDVCFMRENMIVDLKGYKNMEFLGGDF